MKDTAKGSDDVRISELIAAEEELAAVKKEYGVEEKEGHIAHAVTGLFERREARQKILVSRKKYLLLAVFTGWIGGHRFYAKQYPIAILYLLFFWSGFPMAMTIVDILAAIPKPVDEDGKILV